jgi:predicted helicase
MSSQSNDPMGTEIPDISTFIPEDADPYTKQYMRAQMVMQAAFHAFGDRHAGTNVATIRDDLNDSITDGEAIEMLAQHLITRPVFDALFEGYDFARNNPVSKALEGVLEALDEHRLDKEAESLERFYESVKRRAAGIDKADAKQRIVVELYDKFFRNAFPKMTERLGIV